MAAARVILLAVQATHVARSWCGRDALRLRQLRRRRRRALDRLSRLGLYSLVGRRRRRRGWVLKRQVARAAAQGHLVKTAAELELYCFRETFEQARAKRYQNLTPVSDYLEDYHILQTTKEEPLIRAIRNGMEAADVPVETSKGEWGRGQEEINLVYAAALEMADRTALYKHGAKEIAHQHGTAITFMAKYDMTAAGSSFHLHSSLWDKTGRKPLFAAAGRGAKTTSTPLFGQWLAGQMAMARDFSYFYAPSVNSYKRYQSGS